MRSELCHKFPMLLPFVVKVSHIIVGDILRCQQLVIDPETELWAERMGSVVPECTFLARGSGQDLLPAASCRRRPRGGGMNTAE